MTKLKTTRVVAAIIIINEKDEIFSAERAYGDLKSKCEFPGRKIEAGETQKQAQIREIKEKLNTEITVERFFCNFQWSYPIFHLDMDAFICRVKNGQLQIEEGTHMGMQFPPINKLRQKDWCPADSVIVEKIIRDTQNVQPDQHN